MPRGVPKSGKRVYTVKPGPKPKNAVAPLMAATAIPLVSTETDAQIETKLAERFGVMDELTAMSLDGDARSLIISGPGGLGKSFNVEKALKEWDPEQENHEIIKGFVRATGLYKALYAHSEEGKVLVFDDADAVFFDDVCLGLLKAACDTTEERVISWRAETTMQDEEGSLMPTSFVFNGTVIFISNLDFDAMIQKGHKLAPHLGAMISRSHYIDLAMKTKRDYLVRIRMVMKQGLLDYLKPSEQKEVMEYIETNTERLRELSLRMAIKIGNLRKKGGNWQRLANITCCTNA
jgi:hypothetical protein